MTAGSTPSTSPWFSPWAQFLSCVWSESQGGGRWEVGGGGSGMVLIACRLLKPDRIHSLPRRQHQPYPTPSPSIPTHRHTQPHPPPSPGPQCSRQRHLHTHTRTHTASQMVVSAVFFDCTLHHAHMPCVWLVICRQLRDLTTHSNYNFIICCHCLC